MIILIFLTVTNVANDLNLHFQFKVRGKSINFHDFHSIYQIKKWFKSQLITSLMIHCEVINRFFDFGCCFVRWGWFSVWLRVFYEHWDLCCKQKIPLLKSWDGRYMLGNNLSGNCSDLDWLCSWDDIILYVTVGFIVVSTRFQNSTSLKVFETFPTISKQFWNSKNNFHLGNL
jgi:hypothetical protein